MPQSPGPTLFDPLRERGHELARALRTAAKRPTFSLVAITTLGIGIGASTATFSIADAVLVRPLPVHEQGNLAVLWGVDRTVGQARVPVPYGAFKGFADASPRTLSAVAAVDYHGAAGLPVRERGDGVNLEAALDMLVRHPCRQESEPQPRSQSNPYQIRTPGSAPAWLSRARR